MRNETQEQKDALSMIYGSIGTLASYSRWSKDANFMEEILSGILNNRFKELNKSGEEPRYAREAAGGSIGSVWLGRFNNHDVHCMDISFCPSPRLQEKVSYVQRVIGVVDLAKKTYGINYRDSCEPAEIFSHTERVMQDWGLKKTEFKRTPGN
jgi:hypothetical protein